MAGYSGTPLATKLGIKEGHRVLLLNAPAHFTDLLEPLPANVTIVTSPVRSQQANVVVAFFVKRSQFEKRLPAVLKAMTHDAGFWTAWPKKTSKVPTDITENTIREVALPTGLVDNKVCAIDETWSALRLVIRRELRPAPDAKEKRKAARPSS